MILNGVYDFVWDWKFCVKYGILNQMPTLMKKKPEESQ